MADPPTPEPDETDGYEFRYYRQWRTVDHLGVLREYAETVSFRGTEKLGEARTAHVRDCHGGWIGPMMIEPHVSALRVHESARMLPEILASSRDLDTPAEQARFV